MCKKCDAQANDPRSRAFISTGIIEVVPQTEIDKVQNDDGTWPGLTPMASLKVFADSGRAKFESFTLMRDNALAKVSHHEHVICLN